ncbi:hypothetical protein J4217_00910 [Candidatus Pacearchaeota archaeon]|nr:hypothetical protein [Candidatus Pacearchaeota archaeon]
MEYWNSILTEKSWNLLQEIRKKYNFVLIGGWATYLWVGMQKSKDIDIVVDINELQKLKQENLVKNDNLKKYEIKKEEIDIDVYAFHYSKLTIPTEDIRIYSTKIEGFDVVIPEVLLILKQGAELNRRNSIKGEKDRIDIVSLLFFSKIDFNKYFSILKKYKLEDYLNELIKLLKEFKDYNSLNLNPREFKLKRQEIMNKLKIVK